MKSDIINNLLERRSIREGFTDRAIPGEVLETILEAGLSAPSSKNAQPWRVHVVPQGEDLQDIAIAMQNAPSADTNVPIDPSTGEPRRWTSTVRPSARVLQSVPLALFIENRGEFTGGRNNVIETAEEHRENAAIGYGFELLGLGMMINSMWIAARAQGVEGVFMGDTVAAEDYIKERLNIVGDLIGVLAVGYAKHPSYGLKELQPRNITVAYHNTHNLKEPE